VSLQIDGNHFPFFESDGMMSLNISVAASPPCNKISALPYRGFRNTD